MMAGLISRSYLDSFGSVFHSSVGYLISTVNPTWGNKSLNTNLNTSFMVSAEISLSKENL